MFSAMLFFVDLTKFKNDSKNNALTISIPEPLKYPEPNQAESTRGIKHNSKISVKGPNDSDSKKNKVVILLTMMKSGSSIVGSIFNERANVSYLYEPLFPFGEQECDENTRRSSLEVLRNISNCHFENLAPLYNPSKRSDIWGK